MWVPDSTEEFEAKVRSGELFEHSGFEAKRQPVSSFKTARAIAGLAAGGGLFVLGVDEDDDKRLTVLSPIDLAGAAERIDNIVRDAIREVPAIRIQALPLAEDPGRGYLVVVVPASPRAPHMVILDEDNRFYERSARSTVPMDEHKVALYYERRARQQVDRDRVLTLPSPGTSPNRTGCMPSCMPSSAPRISTISSGRRPPPAWRTAMRSLPRSAKRHGTRLCRSTASHPTSRRRRTSGTAGPPTAGSGKGRRSGTPPRGISESGTSRCCARSRRPARHASSSTASASASRPGTSNRPRRDCTCGPTWRSGR